VVAGGEAGADRAVALLADEVHRALAMIGCPRAADLDGGFLFSERTARPDPAASAQPRAGS
jgi:L-lactate dehydrogenase (cytochrome)/(S)-mandelate dehydrogenase